MDQIKDFKPWHTGGGCWSLVYNLNETDYLLITDTTGCDIPENKDTDIYFGLYSDRLEGDYIEIHEGLTFGELIDIWN